ncbi:voltage-dependent calcium channel subunit alpha-2/delta-3-like [Carassius gibelio]|uniref:voltage-dependent calcium channel subunit alpha-2/delta-3-like n=1 Tax=Carassius gibelio TaxID=101364 RepID=UPI002278F032|nr:voltage-dependent calcium channel subunit alpha-2/delta-3-like [Carassius gibelio]
MPFLSSSEALYVIRLAGFWGKLMSQLSKMGMFKRVLLYDYQAMCKVNPPSASGARPLLSICFVASKKSKGDILHPCVTECPSFVYEPSIKETHSMIKCVEDVKRKC